MISQDSSGDAIPSQSLAAKAKDIGAAIGKGIVSEFPGGGVVLELLGIAASKRRDALLEEITLGLHRLEAQVDGFNIESLADNEAFVSTTLDVVAIGVRTHRKAKLEAARNIVLNAALPNAPDDNLQKIFVTWLDQMTEWHFAMLELSRTHRLPAIEFYTLEKGMPTSDLAKLSDVFEDAYPSFSGRFYECIQLLKDLYSWGLVTNNYPSRDMLTSINHAPVPTFAGTEFLKFIESTLQDETDGA